LLHRVVAVNFNVAPVGFSCALAPTTLLHRPRIECERARW
jgi:hypothetical protein